MNTSSRSTTEFNAILALAGIVVFTLGLFNKKTRGIAGRALQFGFGMVADNLAKRYLPANGYRLAKVVTSYMPLNGSKGGKAAKRAFKKAGASRTHKKS